MIGFCEMLLIVQPGSAGIKSYKRYALLIFLCVNSRDLITRSISKHAIVLVIICAYATSLTILAELTMRSANWKPLDL